MNDRAEIEAHFLKAAAALLHAGKKAVAAFEECGFISVRSFKTKQPRGHKNKAALSTKKPRSAPSACCKIKAHVSKVAAAFLYNTRTMKPDADRGFFVERSQQCTVRVRVRQHRDNTMQ